jgi:hypothetical protein
MELCEEENWPLDLTGQARNWEVTKLILWNSGLWKVVKLPAPKFILVGYYCYCNRKGTGFISD